MSKNIHKPDYYSSPEECKENKKLRINSNPRYKNFLQTHFTAGDENQFEENNDRLVNLNGFFSPVPEHNVFKNIEKDISWDKYTNIGPFAVDNTFKYMFNKFKKGVFIKIKDGELKVFLPFSKNNFTNEWSKYIKVEPNFKNVIDYLQYVNKLSGCYIEDSRINKFVDGWYANNSLFRYEYPINEGDTNIPELRDMFKTLCKERCIPDIEIFINRRDFPVITKKGTEPYDNIYGDNVPLLSHNYDKYCPILSMVETDDNADIAIPTADDWARISRKEGKYFLDTYKRSFNMPCVNWEDRKPIAVFRGGSTGCGTTIETNPRLKVAYLSQKSDNKDIDGLPYIDAGITEWNLRPRKTKNNPYLQTIDIKNIGIKLVDSMSPEQQSTYKYLINIDGHVSAYRLSLELESGSCILMVDSKYRLWYKNILKPYIHYVPVKSDLSDLIEKVKWCKNNDEKCKKIASNAKLFADMYLCKKGILDYLEKLLIDVKVLCGNYVYNTVSFQDIQYKLEKRILKNMLVVVEKNIQHIDIVDFKNDIQHFKSINWIVDTLIKNKKLHLEEKEIFKNKVSTICEVNLGGLKIIKKKQDINNIQSITHETFVGKVLNEYNTLQNFVYTFNMFTEGNQVSILQQKVEGITFLEYIDKHFNMYTYFNILLQIALTLEIALNNCGFVHNDLTPWNIILKKYKTDIIVEYPISDNQVYKIKTDIVPVIIDYEKSHIIHNNIHHGKNNMFSVSSIQDIISILSTSIYEIVNKKQFNVDETSKIIKLCNFISGTKYKTDIFKHSGKDGLGQVRFFFKKSKKYSELVSSNKYELEKLKPLDFVKYMMKNVYYTSNIQIDNHIQLSYNHNIRQLFDFYTSTSIEEKIKSFIDVFDRVLLCDFSSVKNNIAKYYTINSIEKEIETTYNSMKNFFIKNNIQDTEQYIQKYKDCILFFKNSIKKDYNKWENIVLPEIPCFDSYNEKLFLEPEKVLNLLKLTSDVKIYNLNLFTQIKYKNRDYEKFINTITFEYKNSLCHINTLRYFSKKIYKSDMEFVCKNYKNIDIYKNILNLLPNN